MNQIKSLAEQIRQRQQEPLPKGKRRGSVADTGRNESPIIESIITDQIRQCGQGEVLSQMVHIRLSGKDYRKLITLGAAKISTQKIALYAIRQLLEQDEIKKLLKTLIDDLD